MSVQISKGKLKNTHSGKELEFLINPTQYEITQSFDFAIEGQLGQSTPLVAFRSGGGAQLRVQLVFDADIAKDKKATLGQAASFFLALNEIDPETASVAPVEFEMGNQNFRGYVRSYRWNATRFNPMGEVVSATVALELLSDGSFEKGGAK